MNVYGALLFGGCAAAASAAIVLAACNAPDPAAFEFVDRGGDSGGTTPDQTPATTPPVAPKGDPVFGLDAFQYADPGEVADQHDGTHVGNKPLEGKNCVQSGCHLDPAPQHWKFAGTVFQALDGGVVDGGGVSDAGNATVPRAEVRVVGPDGGVFGKAYTDANGNFWLSGNAGDYPLVGSKVGVRREGGPITNMVATIGGSEGAGCNAAAGCHGDPKVRIFAP